MVSMKILSKSLIAILLLPVLAFGQPAVTNIVADNPIIQATTGKVGIYAQTAKNIELFTSIDTTKKGFYIDGSTGGLVSQGSAPITSAIVRGDSYAVFGDTSATDVTGAGDGQFFAHRNGNAKIRTQAFGTNKIGYFACDRARGTVSAPTALGADETMCSWVSQGYDGTNWAHSAEILTNTTEAWTGSAHGAEIEFLTILDASTSQYAALRLNDNGTGENLLYGGAASTGHLSLVLGHASATTRFQNSSAATMWSVNNSGVITQDATNGSFLRFTTSNAGILEGLSSLPTDLTNITGTAPTVVSVKNTSSDANNISLMAIGANANAATIDLMKSRATDGTADTIVSNNDEIGSLNFLLADGASFRYAARIVGFVNGTPAASDAPGGLNFYTTADGGTSQGLALTLGQDKSAAFTGTMTSSRTTDLGWSWVVAANQACNTTCTSACVFGIDTGVAFGASAFVECSSASADLCRCAGAS